MRFEDCRFGLVVRHWSYGLGMIEVLVPKTSTVNVCFEFECVNMSPFDLELGGDIRLFEWMRRARKDLEEQEKAEKLAISDSNIHDQS
jgi:hypothetical protein